MAVTVWTAGQVVKAADLNDTFGSKVNSTNGTITAGSAAATPLTISGVSGQTGALFTANKTAGTVVYSIGANGNSLQTSLAADSTPVTIRGASGQTAALVDVQDSSATSHFIVDASGNAKVIGTATNSGPARLQMNGQTSNAGFYHREVFAIGSVAGATEITRLTSTGANGYRAYFKIIVSGHTGNVNNGINIKEFYWDGGTNAPVQISTYTATSAPTISFNNATNNVCIVRLASSDGTNNFNGVMMVEWLIPVDFGGSTGTIS